MAKKDQANAAAAETEEKTEKTGTNTFVLCHPDEERTFDVVQHTPKKKGDTPFPVAEPLEWVDVTELEVKPEYGWSAKKIDGEWKFTDPNKAAEETASA